MGGLLAAGGVLFLGEGMVVVVGVGMIPGVVGDNKGTVSPILDSDTPRPPTLLLPLLGVT